jgi:hypothetical protein
MCTPVELAFFVAIAVFVLIAGVGSWWSTSLISMLRFRFPAMHGVLGNPDPLIHAESTSHAAAMLRFVFSKDADSLGDVDVSKHVAVIRVCAAVSGVALAVMVMAVLGAGEPNALITLACWRNG